MKLLKSFLSLLLPGCATVLFMNGCATILHGSEEGVYFSSEPDNAKVYINGEMKGTTPVQLRLVSRNSYNVEFKKDGFAAKSVYLDNGIGGGWLIFDLVCGVLPAIVDAATGCWYTFDQVHLSADLERLAQGGPEIPAPKQTVEPPAPGKEYAHIGTGHWVKKVMDNGKMVVLEDDSVWEIAPSDAVTAAKWLNATPISVGIGKGDYPYQLIDVPASKAVQAKYVGQK